jgi:hypothetical protein
MKILKRHWELVLITLIVFGLTLANSWHIVSRYFTRPPNTIFIGISHYHEDYFYYLSQLAQGAQGAWRVSNLYTAEPIPPQLLWWPNILLGKIAALTQLPAWTVFDLALIIIAAFSLVAVYWTIRLIYPNDSSKRVAAFLIAAMTSTFYFVSRTPDGSWSIVPHQFFYNYTSSLNRLGGVFHLILQNILSIIMIVSGAKIFDHIFWQKYPPRMFLANVATAAVSAFLLMFINPVYIITNAGTLTITALILTVWKRPPVMRLTKLLAAGLVITLPLTIPYLSMQIALREFYFQYFRWWETNVKRVTPEEFFLSLGPLAILAVIGLIPFLKKDRALRLTGVIWAFFPLTLYFTWIPIKFQFPFFRLPQPPHYLVFGALAAEALFLPSQLFSHLGKPRFGRFVFTVLVIVWCLIQLPAINLEVKARNQSHALQSWLNYLPPGLKEGMDFLKNAPDQKSLVLAINNVELITPALSGRKVFVGHHSITLNYPEKITAASRFFIRAMTPDEGRSFIRDNRIGYILWRHADGPADTLSAYYPFLSVAFRNNEMTVFGVNL